VPNASTALETAHSKCLEGNAPLLSIGHKSQMQRARKWRFAKIRG
jgi:hypothetical protein